MGNNAQESPPIWENFRDDRISFRARKTRQAPFSQSGPERFRRTGTRSAKAIAGAKLLCRDQIVAYRSSGLAGVKCRCSDDPAQLERIECLRRRTAAIAKPL